ncbi:phosphate acyltransferase [Intestinimonas sp.]|uniref:phosphate acyltransferase n=1 Tax=Intestinimonas sp. TaxID=1965293 RepID=UPI0026273909|nr:phosphate acyltransferase [Intestinimonas sp.]
MLKNFDEVLEKVRSIEPFTVSVAAAEDEELLRAVKAAADLGFVRPVLTGDPKAVGGICDAIGLKPLDILEAHGEEEAVAVAVKAVREGGAQVLMKGLVNTSIYMRGILNKEHGLRTGRLLSMMAVYEAPGYHKLVYCSDSGINVAPDLEQKKDILKNILLAVKSIGVENPRVAALTANEMLDPKIQSTVDAAGLVEYVRGGGLGPELPCIIEGPIAFDVAFDPHAAAHKKIDSKITGETDVVIFPNMEAGNIMGKSWIHLCKCRWAGIVLGATHPVILGSRADTPEIKLNSIALACLAARS